MSLSDAQKDRWVGVIGPLVGVILGASIGFFAAQHQRDRAAREAAEERAREAHITFVGSARLFQSEWKDVLSCTAGDIATSEVISSARDVQLEGVRLEVISGSEEVAAYVGSVATEVNALKQIVVDRREAAASGGCQSSDFPSGDELVDLESDLLTLLEEQRRVLAPTS